MYSPSQACLKRVNVSRMAKTRGGSHIKDGNEVIRRTRYFIATSLVFATRWQLHLSKDRSSIDIDLGRECSTTCLLRSPIAIWITYKFATSISRRLRSCKRTYFIDNLHHARWHWIVFVNTFIDKVRWKWRWHANWGTHWLNIVHSQKEYNLAWQQISYFAVPKGYDLR